MVSAATAAMGESPAETYTQTRLDATGNPLMHRENIPSFMQCRAGPLRLGLQDAKGDAMGHRVQPRLQSLDDRGASEWYRCLGCGASDGVMDVESTRKLVWVCLFVLRDGSYVLKRCRSNTAR